MYITKLLVCFQFSVCHFVTLIHQAATLLRIFSAIKTLCYMSLICHGVVPKRQSVTLYQASLAFHVV